MKFDLNRIVDFLINPPRHSELMVGFFFWAPFIILMVGCAIDLVTFLAK